MTTTIDIDATGQSLGRMATRISMALRGKDTPGWTPNVIPDVKVVVRNLDKVVFTGTKAQTKIYRRHSGYPGGLYERTLEAEWARDKAGVLRRVVRGMLPENRQRDILLTHLTVE